LFLLEKHINKSQNSTKNSVFKKILEKYKHIFK